MGLRRCEAIGVFPGSFRPPTMPSADSCPITDRVTPAGAVEPSPVRLGFAALVPSAASACDGRPGRLVRRSPVPAVVPEATRKHPTATSGRSPRIRTWTFAAQPRHLPCSRTRGLRCAVPTRPGAEPSMAFLSVGSQLCLRLPSDPSSRRRPCHRLAVLVCLRRLGSPAGDFHPIDSTPMPGVHRNIRRPPMRPRAADASVWADPLQ